MRRAEKHETKRRHVDGPIILVVGASHVVGVKQSALHQDAAQAVRNPDDGVLEGALALAKQCQARHEGLCVLVDKVVARAAVVAPRVDVGVVPVHQDVGLQALERRRQQVHGPEDSVFGRPRLVGAAIQAVHEDNVDLGVRVSVYGGGLIP